MPTLTLRNIPDPVYLALKAHAQRNRRSLNSEAVTRLELSVKVSPPDIDAEIARIRRLQRLYKGPAQSPTQIDTAIDAGRALKA